jgi:hypothetical protein
VLSERVAAHKEEFSTGGIFLGPSPRSLVFEKRFYALLKNQTQSATEAIAALLCFYVGEHTAEELVCEAVSRAKRIEGYLVRFQTCVPETGLEPLEPYLTRIPNLRNEALEAIRTNTKPCEFE